MKYFALLLLTLPASAQTTNPSSVPVILTSTLLAALVSAGVSALVALKLKDKEYRNDYYKQIIGKRLKVYEYLEKQLVQLRPHVLDDEDQKMYLKIFSKGKEYWQKSTRNQLSALNASFWLTYDTHTLLANLNKIIIEIGIRYDTSDDKELIKAGKEYDYMLSSLRIDLEAALRKDMQELYDVNKFFKGRDSRLLWYQSSAHEMYKEAAERKPLQNPYSGFANNTFFKP